LNEGAELTRSAQTATLRAVTLFPGVRLLTLDPHADRRGTLTEVYRQEWCAEVPGRQINVTRSRATVMRGPHVHCRHGDYFVVVAGRGLVGLHDARRASPTFGQALLLELAPEAPAALVVPPGVVHGMFFPVDSVLVTVESELYDPDEEVRCRWSDPELGIDWPFAEACTSDADAAAQSYAEMMEHLEPFQATFVIDRSQAMEG
jgi:dTDP-4-dehydrorhamnose 3,5-epimerase